MDPAALRRLIVRHRHVAPMLSALLAGTNARVTITDADGGVILDRQAGDGPADAPAERRPIQVDGVTVGWVDGPRPAGAIAAVLSYAAAREADKRALAREALDRYRELNLIYDLAGTLGSALDVASVASIVVDEASRVASGGTGFIALRTGPDADRLDGGILRAILDGEPEIVNDVAGDPRATDGERAMASLVAAPLRLHDRRIGVVGTYSATPREFHASDLKLIAAIAALAAPTLNQVATHEATLRSA